MAADLSSMPLPSPAPAGAADSVRPTPAPKNAAKPDAPTSTGRSFADELSRADHDVPERPLKPLTQPAGPKAPAANEANDAPKPDAAARQTLSPLKKVVQTNKQEVDNAPVVAFLTGHLEKLPPAQIPELVSGNRFLTDAISDADLSSFLSKPASISDLIKDLGLPTELLDQAEQLGLDTSAKVPPAELLRTLGMDPQRVFAELKVLKDNLALEGVSGYIARAKALSGTDPTHLAPATPQAPVDQALAKTSKAVPGAVDPGTLVTVPVPPGKVPAQPVIPQRREAGMPALKGDASVGPQLSPDAVAAMTQALFMQTLQAGKSAAGDVGTAAADTLDKLGVSTDPLKGPDLGKLLAALDPTRLAKAATDGDATGVLGYAAVANPVVAGAAAAPAVAAATFDAFQSLGDRLNVGETRRVDFTPKAGDKGLAEDGAAQLPTGDQLMERLQSPKAVATPLADARPLADVLPLRPIQAGNLTAPQPQSKAMTEMLPKDLAAALAGPVRPLPSEPVPPLKDLLSGLTPQASPLPQGAKGLGGLFGSQQADLSTLVPVAALASSGERSGDGGGNTGGSTNQDGGNSRQDGQPRAVTPDKTIHDLLALKHANAPAVGKSFQTHVDGVPGLTSAERLGLMQQVIDRATMLSKGGGGTMRIDLGSAQLGHLEMAVNMQGDRLDLRVIAGSDRVKDAMMQDLGQLRSALSVQNVQLGRVEVGVGQRQPGSFGFAGNGQQGQGQQQTQQQTQQAQQQLSNVRPASVMPRTMDLRPPASLLDAYRRPAGALATGTYGGNGRIAGRA